MPSLSTGLWLPVTCRARLCSILRYRTGVDNRCKHMYILCHAAYTALPGPPCRWTESQRRPASVPPVGKGEQRHGACGIEIEYGEG